MSKANPQADHYRTLHDAYARHYYDDSSLQYRREFIYRPLMRGVSLGGASVADLACGSGYNSLELKKMYPNLRTVGFDISEEACADYRELTGERAHCVDLTRVHLPEEQFDAAVIIGGVHHCVADLPTFFENIARIVRPGGYFFMMEPSEDFLLSRVRRAWYKQDKWFEENSERALRHAEILGQAQPWFAQEFLQYFGGPAFYFILNSLITRVPLRLKPYLASVLFPLERIYNKLPGKKPFAAFLATWKRTDDQVR